MEHHERVALVGTAQSWKLTPWADPGLWIVSLNDAYRMQGFVRADAWYDLHPLDHFFYPPEGEKTVFAHQVPPGHYSRPKGHLAWLGAQTIPVWLNPGYREQHPPAVDWKHAHPFPKADIEAEFGRYFTSSPAWIIAHLVQQGVRELAIYGIHLATEHEYIEQRPNFEYLIGRILGRKRQTIAVRDGMRHYSTADGHVALPEASPVLQSNFQYAFQPRPRAALESLKFQAHKIAIKRERALKELRTLPRWKRRQPTIDRLDYLEAWQADTQDQLQRATQAAEG